MQQYACPNCGAPIVFRSSISVYSTCTYCRSMVVRHDMKLETLGQVAELLDDMSPFQVGTTGTYQNRSFTLVGRVKVVYSKGTWSEWVALFDDGSHGWLAEAQGSYMMTFEQPNVDIEVPQAHKPGEEAKIDGKSYLVEDARVVAYVASEGELPYPFTPKESVTSIDLMGNKGEFASLTISKRGTTAFLGEYVPFDDFHFQNLRTLDGW